MPSQVLPEILAMIDFTQNKSLSVEGSNQLGKSCLDHDVSTDEDDVKPSSHDWSEMVEMVTVATKVLAAHKQQQ